MAEPNAILAISSLDRFSGNVIVNGRAQPVLLDRGIYYLYRGDQPNQGFTFQSGSEFTIESTGAMMYGYIKTIGVSQVQIDYRIPTIIPGRNDIFTILVGAQQYDVVIPYGFYTPQELAALLTILLRNIGPAGNPALPDMTVTYVPPYNPQVPFENGDYFLFESNNPAILFDFPQFPPGPGGAPPTPQQVPDLDNRLKCYRLFGILYGPFTAVGGTDAFQTASPTFLYTPFIDIHSNTLTKYQKIKDTDSSPIKRGNMVARVYLTGIGSPQYTTSEYALGSRPFMLTVDLNTAKTIRWDRDEAIYSLDFQLYDQYGDLIYWDNGYPTEFQMTLMCSEGAE